ncbi:WXG100 protein secretion system (Wss), protein YukD [Lachnospiraceae bacterium XBB2008]|nr:WXG100 protein secretion system (Wss), protein YukD [Lachnospiraceae bacterium XBB2008]
MIIVDVFVPAVDRTYNFSLNESVSIGSIISEVTEMIEQKERVHLAGNKAELRLYNKEKKCPLPEDNTLNECSIKTGESLILV